LWKASNNAKPTQNEQEEIGNPEITKKRRGDVQKKRHVERPKVPLTRQWGASIPMTDRDLAKGKSHKSQKKNVKVQNGRQIEKSLRGHKHPPEIEETLVGKGERARKDFNQDHVLRQKAPLPSPAQGTGKFSVTARRTRGRGVTGTKRKRSDRSKKKKKREGKEYRGKVRRSV